LGGTRRDTTTTHERVAVNGELVSYPTNSQFRPTVNGTKPLKNGDETPRKIGRPRIYASVAEKKRAYRARKKRAKYFRTQFTGEQEWYTPVQYLDAVRQVLGVIELDPASSDEAQQTVQATRYFTAQENGLSHAWGGRIFLNPPYTQPLIEHFVTRLVEEFHQSHVQEAILLSHNYTDTKWFHRAESAAACLCFTRGRIKFIDTKGNRAAPPQGQVFFYFGRNPERFTEVFAQFGTIRWGQLPPTIEVMVMPGEGR
jgi:phage N-6-adenine-methyltransferase